MYKCTPHFSDFVFCCIKSKQNPLKFVINVAKCFEVQHIVGINRLLINSEDELKFNIAGFPVESEPEPLIRPGVGYYF